MGRKKVGIGKEHHGGKTGGALKLSIRDGLLLIAFAAAPIYLLPSGYPQIGDLVLSLWALLVALWAISKNSLSLPSSTHPSFYFTILLIYMIISNLSWAVATSDVEFLQPALFSTFNLIIFVSASVLIASPSSGFRTLALGAAISLAICVATAPFTYIPGTSRQVFTFNNPNQLGYHVLLCATVFMQTKHSLGEKTSRLVGVAVVLAGLTLAAFSNSKAALVAFGVLVAASYWRDRSIALVLFGIIAAALLLGTDDESQAARTVARLETLGRDSDDSAEGRGYGRILSHPAYLFLGAGEARHDRFSDRPGVAMELHSTIGTVAFSYGIPGLTFFVLGLLSLLRSGAILQIAPLLLYGLTHQGLRQPLFWISILIAGASSGRIRMSSASLRSDCNCTRHR